MHWIPPGSGESDLHQNSNAGQRDRVRLTGSRSRMEEAVSKLGGCAASTVQQTSNAGGVMGPKDGPWLRCGCDISCVTHGGPQERSSRVHINGQSCILTMLNWLLSKKQPIIKRPKTAECRRSDLRPGQYARHKRPAPIFWPHALVMPRSLTVSSQPLFNATGSRCTVLLSLFLLAPQTAVATADPVVSSVFAPSLCSSNDSIPARVLAV